MNKAAIAPVTGASFLTAAMAAFGRRFLIRVLLPGGHGLRLSSRKYFGSCGASVGRPTRLAAPFSSQLMMNRFCGRRERNPALPCGEWAADNQISQPRSIGGQIAVRARQGACQVRRRPAAAMQNE